MRLTAHILVLLFVAVGVLYTQHMVSRAAQGDPYTAIRSAPTLAKVRDLAKLVTLDVPVSDVYMSELGGFTGGVKIAIAIHGDVQIMTDMDHAQFDDLDLDRQSVTLVLPKPRPQRPRVDHEKTRIIDIQRTGLWKLKMGQAGEQQLTDRAYAEAQRILLQAAKDPQLIARACARTEHVMNNFFGALGWKVAVQWDDHVDK